MSKRVVREFQWVHWRYGKQNTDMEATFHEETVRAEVACDGRFLQENGHLAALALLRDAVQPWLDENWHSRLIVPGGDPDFFAYCMRFEWPREPYLLPGGDDAAALALHLLTEVATPALAGTGLDLMHVTIRRLTEMPVVAHYLPAQFGRQPKAQADTLAMDERIIQVRTLFAAPHAS